MKIVRFFKNKYILVAIFFIVWMLFFDHNNLFLHFQYRSELNDLKKKKKYYQEQIERTRNDVEMMKTNPAWKEKIAREQYLMKKDNEDLYLIKEIDSVSKQ
ncbi:MAG: septum formation initiator family protein [Chitinophagia bacterium]|jgi:cell division protein DivIC|nr:septum formation initiator family protein [Chitinophagia bacterium]